MSNKIGDVVENYHGQFAKVIRFTDGGITHLSAWVRTPELAEEEVVSTSYLNDFGLSQVLKGGENVEREVEVASADEAKVTSKASKTK